MSETPERYSEEEALTEAERLSRIVQAGEGKRDYEDAERWLKAIDEEVRPRFSEEEFMRVENAFDDLSRWPDDDIIDEERDEEVRSDLATLIANREVVLSAYEYRPGFLYKFHKIAQGMGITATEKIDRDGFRAFGMGILKELSPKIIEDIQKGRHEAWALPSLSLLAESEDEDTRKLGIEGLIALRKDIGEFLLDYNFSFHAVHALMLMRKNGTSEQSLVAAEIAQSTLPRIKDRRLQRQLIAFLATHDSPEIVAEGERKIQEVLSKHHLPLELLDIWKKSATCLGQEGTTLDQAIEKNISSIIELEHLQSGTCELLYRDFGIADFGRYPIQLLSAQYEEADNISNPYGVVIFPRNDWNGAFYQNRFELNQLYEKLQGGFNLRVMECEGKIDVARALIEFNKRYNPLDGNGHKISLAIIGGHGTQDSIRFGGDDERHALFTQDFQGRGVQRTSEFFEENPTFILVSCSTGADKGIGQKLSEVMGAKVIAPKVPTSIAEYQVGKRPGGKFRFNAKYVGDKKGGEVKSVYVGGDEREK